jgi:hypothetical protein
MNEYARAYARVERRARRRGSFVLNYVPWLLALAAAAIFGRVWTQARAVELVEEIAALGAEERELALAGEDARRRLVALTTRERISREARERLGMTYPDESDVVFLPVAASPEPARRPQPGDPAAPPGLAGFLEERLRGLVSEEAYALGAR